MDTAGGIARTREREERGAARVDACGPPEMEGGPVGDLRRVAKGARGAEEGRAGRAGSGGAGGEERSVGVSKGIDRCREEAEVGASRVDGAWERGEVVTGAEVFKEGRRREGATEGANAAIPAAGGKGRAERIEARGGVTTSAVLGRAEGKGLGPAHWVEARVSGASEGMSKKRAESETGTESPARELQSTARSVGLTNWSLEASGAGVGDGDMEVTIREDSRVRVGRTVGEETTCIASAEGSRGVLGSSRVTVVMSRGYMRSLLWRRTRGRVSCFLLFRMELRDAMSAIFRATAGPPNTSVIRGWLRSVAMSLACSAVG